MPGILQQRIQVVPVRRRPAAGARTDSTCSSMNSEEADADDAQHAEHAAAKRPRAATAAGGDGERPDREHQDPQQQRAFVPAPRRGEPVEQRQRRVRVLRDVQDREVVVTNAYASDANAIATSTN